MNKKSLSALLLAFQGSALAISASPIEALTVTSIPTDSEWPDSTRTISLDGVTVISTPKELGAMRQQPSSVSLLPASKLDAAQVTSLKGVSALVPNLFIPDYGSRLTSAIYIRGIGSRLNTPAVGMYVDNIPYADKSAFNFNFYDIERIDVLRGPQGTLYGRNAMGGIIRVVTKNPFNYEGTDVKLSYATGDNHRNLVLTHYHRINDKFAFAGGGYYEGGDGFFKNDFTGKKADKMQAGGGRIHGLYKATDKLSFDFNINYDYTDEGAYPYYYIGSYSNGDYIYEDQVGKISNNRESSYRRSLLNAGLNIEYKADRWQMNAVTGYQNLNDRMFMDQDFLSPDIYTLEQKQRINTVTEEVSFKNTSNDTRWHWVSGANVMYQTLHTEGPVNFYADGIKWLQGNINRYMPDVSQIQSLSRMGFTSMSMNFRDESLLMGGEFETPMLNAAAFHQSTFDLTSRLSLTLGVRLDYEQTKMDYNAPALINYGFTLANPRAAVMQVDLQDLSANLLYKGSLKNDYLKILPKAALTYDLGSNGNVYLSVAKGQRSGGYNVQMFSDLLQGAMQNAMMKGIQEGVSTYLEKFITMGMPESVISSVTQTMKDNMPVGEDPSVEQVVYKPEYSWNYEVGTHLNLDDHRLQLDAAAYLIDTHDQQIARFAPTGFGRMMVNAGKSRSYGAEFSSLYRPDEHWSLMGSYGYTHATFTDYDAGGNQDYTGNYVPFVPMHTLNLDAAYTFLFNGSNVRSLTLGATYNGTGRIYWTESNLAYGGCDYQDFYSTLGARLQLTLSKATIQLWGRNLTDKEYNTFYFESASRCFEQHGKPRQVGIDVKWHF